MNEKEAKQAAFQKTIGMPTNFEDEALAIVDVIWQAACEWRDSQVGEPISTVEILTIGKRKQVTYPHDPRTFGLTDGVHKLYATPPTAQINEQMREALESAIDVAETLAKKLNIDDFWAHVSMLKEALAAAKRGAA